MNPGDLVSATVLGQNIIIIGSYNVADALLNRKGSIYSDRPVFPMAGDLVGWSKETGLMQFGEQHRIHRTLLSKAIGSNDEMRKYHSMMETEVATCLYRLLHHHEPDQISKGLYQYVNDSPSCLR
jgi:cytochrome P450